MFKCSICGYCPINKPNDKKKIYLYGHVIGNSPNIKENQYLILCKKHKQQLGDKQK